MRTMPSLIKDFQPGAFEDLMHLLSCMKRGGFLFSTPDDKRGHIHHTQRLNFFYKGIEELLPRYIKHHLVCAFYLVKSSGVFKVLFSDDLLIVQKGVPQSHFADKIVVETIYELA